MDLSTIFLLIIGYAGIGLLFGVAWSYIEIGTPKAVESRESLLQSGFSPDFAVLVWITITLAVGILFWPGMLLDILRRS